MIIDQSTNHPPARTMNIRFDGFNALMALMVGGLLCVFCPGCGDPDRPAGLTKQAVAINEVPEALKKAAKREVPGIDFSEAWQNRDSKGNLESYEIRGRQASSGKIREVRVSLTGEILESE
jgi:hypothetical protein